MNAASEESVMKQLAQQAEQLAQQAEQLAQKDATIVELQTRVAALEAAAGAAGAAAPPSAPSAVLAMPHTTTQIEHDKHQSEMAEAAVSSASAYAESMGLQLGGNGVPFSGDFGRKGLYSYRNGPYAGMAFFGTGGSEAEETAPFDDGNKHRVDALAGEALKTAIGAGDVGGAAAALAKGATVTQVLTAGGSNALQWAAFKGQAAVCEFLLLNHGAAVDAARKDGMTALFLAAQNGHPEAVSLLLSNGAAVDAAEEHGVTPLFMAASQGDLEMATLLLTNGAAVDAARDNGDTALLLAVKNRHLEVASLLLSNGAAVDANGIHVDANGIHATLADGYMRDGLQLLQEQRRT